jgi:carboxymethylenebutenolidase
MNKKWSVIGRLLFGVVLCDSVVSCSPAQPPATEKPQAETPPPVQETVSYLADAPNVHGFLCRPPGKGPSPAVLLIHDRMGLTDGIKDATFRLARDGYVVLAVDLYRGQVAKSAKVAERLERELPKERALRDLKTAIDYLSERVDVRAAQLQGENRSIAVGAVGLGIGGSYALEAALHDPRWRALALCYCPLPTEAKQLKALDDKASVFYISAGKDKSVSLETIAKFCQAMNEAGKRLYALPHYGDCPRGFLDPANWPIDGKPPEKNVEDAWWLIARYLDRTLM